MQNDSPGQSTVWKFHNLAIAQILREINFRDSRSAKSAISIHLLALNCNFFEFLHFLKALIGLLELLDSPKLISRKIKMTEKS